MFCEPCHLFGFLVTDIGLKETVLNLGVLRENTALALYIITNKFKKSGIENVSKDPHYATETKQEHSAVFC